MRWTIPVTLVAAGFCGMSLSGQGQPSANAKPQGATGRARSPVIIAEVLFDPGPGEAPFVELLNTGSAPVVVSRMALRIGNDHISLARVTSELAAGSRLLVRFTGQGRAEGSTYSAPASVKLDPGAGAIDLRDERDECLDYVAWGVGHGAVDSGSDEMFGGSPPHGRTIGRPPGAHRPMNPGDWVVYSAEQATPGGENPLPRVDMLLPFDGDALRSPITLRWYPAVGAVSYRLQVARDASFADFLVNREVQATRADAVTLAPGRYVWRVQAIGVQGRLAAFSTPSTLEIAAAGVAANRATPVILNVLRAQGRSGSQAPLPPTLPVALLRQRKDTQLLQLEARNRRGDHAWDARHVDYDQGDPSDSHNCAVASVAMVNHFFGGDLSQDRIAVEVRGSKASDYVSAAEATRFFNPGVATRHLKERHPGPEWDLVYGDGLYVTQVQAAIMFALSPRGAAPSNYLPTTRVFETADEIWNAVEPQISNRRPVIAMRKHPGTRTSHYFVVKGLGVATGNRRFLVVNDPINGEQRPFIDGTTTSDFVWFFMPANASARRQEIEVTTDSDLDQVMDFDETERFHTDPRKRDTDGDGVADKEDIASGVFDSFYGYSLHPNAPNSQGRDFDEDHVPTELDPDSDSGGCYDGVEDQDANGDVNGQETWNFRDEDDVCREISGHITSVTSGGTTGKLSSYGHSRFHVTVSLEPATPGEMGPLVDTGRSRFRLDNAGQLELDLGPGCQAYSRASAGGSGSFVAPEGTIGGHVSEDVLVVGANAEAPGSFTTDLCIMSGTESQAGTGSLPECEGRRVPNTNRFVFDCHTPPPTLPGTYISEWSVTGSVTLAPPAPAPGFRPFGWHRPSVGRRQVPPSR